MSEQSEYWARSGFETQFTAMVRQCFDSARFAHRSDSNLRDFERAVDSLVLIAPTEVKNAVTEWEQKYKPKVNKHQSIGNEPLDIYKWQRAIMIAKVDMKLRFITNEAEKLGLLVKHTVKRRRGSSLYEATRKT